MRNSEFTPSLQRIDATYSLPFLSACAAALHEQGLLSELEADNLRLSLKERHRSLGEGEATLFSELVAERNSLIQLLEARCGSLGLSQIFLAWTTARILEQSVLALEQWAGSLLKKSELMFNQTFYVFSVEGCERRTLFSFFLVDCAEHLHALARSLQNSSQALQVVYSLTPRGSTEGRAWESSFAQHLGFRLDQAESLSSLEVQEVIKKVLFELDILGDRMGAIVFQLNQNLKIPATIDSLQLLLEDWSVILGQLKALSLIPQGSLERRERKRLQMMRSLLNLNAILDPLHRLSVESIKLSNLTVHPPQLWPEAERRELLARLLKQGTGYLAAHAALETLQNYCQQHGVAVHQLLASELGRIHPQLNEGILPILQNVAKDKDLGTDATKEKQIVFTRKQKLMQLLNQGAGTLLIVCISLLFSACGVKTAPRSDVLDLRPAVPYHAEQSVRPRTPKEGSTTPPHN